MDINQTVIDTEYHYLQTARYYDLYYWAGIISQIVCWVALFSIVCKRHHRANPMGILLNLIIVQICLSLRTLVAGALFQIWGLDFFRQSYNGDTINFYCSFEGLYYYTFFLAEFLWDIIWLYDYCLTVKFPNLYTGKYLMYYSCVAYFTAFGISISVFFQNQDNYISKTNLTCVVDEDTVYGFELLLRIPIFIYILTFVYVYLKYGLTIELSYEKAKTTILRLALDREEQLIAREVYFNKTMMKLSQIIKLQKTYFILRIILLLPYFFYSIGEMGLYLYSIFNCLHPFVTVIVLIRAFIMKVQDLERGLELEGKPVPEPEVTELSEYSIAIDEIAKDISLDKKNLLANFKENNGDGQAQQKARKREENKEMGPLRVIPQEQLDEYKRMVEKVVIKYILLGIQKSLFEKAEPKFLYDTNIGFGAAPENRHRQHGNQAFDKLMVNVKEFVQPQEGGSQMISKDFNEGAQLEGLVLGHPDTLRKFNIKMKEDDLMLQARTERISVSYDVDVKPAEPFKFIELAPEIFQIIRRINNINEKTVRALLSWDNISNINVEISGNSGTFFLTPDQGGILLKSINKAEYTILQGFVPDYFKHVLMNPNTYLVPLLGVYTVEISKNGQIMPIHFVIMKNLKGFDKSRIEPDDIMHTFDIKGQIQGRKVLDHPQELLDLESRHNEKHQQTLKDQDFLQSYKTVDISQQQSEILLAQLESDIDLLVRHQIVNYSLLMVVINKPFKDISYQRQNLSPFFEEYKEWEEDLPTFSSKELAFTEIDISTSAKKEDIILAINEKTRDRTKVFHMCDPIDISIAKTIYADQQSSSLIQEPLRIDIVVPQAINFSRPTVSYDFAQIMQEKKREEKSLSAHRKKSGTITGLINLMRRTSIQVDKKEDHLKKKLLRQKTLTDRAKQCLVCKNQKMNHIVSEQIVRSSDRIRDELNKMTQGEVIEQIIFDPKLGLVKREIHFAIIDYASTYGLQKMLEDYLKDSQQEQPDVLTVKPSVYQERFMTTMKKIFQ